MSEQDSNENDEALDMYDRASSDLSQVEAVSNPVFNYVSYIVDDMRDTVTDMRLQYRFGDLNGVHLRIERVAV